MTNQRSPIEKWFYAFITKHAKALRQPPEQRGWNGLYNTVDAYTDTSVTFEPPIGTSDTVTLTGKINGKDFAALTFQYSNEKGWRP